MDSLPSSQPPSAPDSGDPHGSAMPRRFGKYTLLRKLASGGMAELFLAIQRSVAGFEKLIVIKLILPAMNQDSAFIAMLLHEARIAATLSHANVVQVFDVGQVAGTYYIAMEHVHGEDLRSIVRQMRKKAVSEFPLEHIVSIMLGVCGGLAHAHEKRDLDGSSLKIVHRDISPHNVVVSFSGDVKIVDFGIAQSNAELAAETRSGTLKGKVPYMSPEQARGDEIDSRSDIFAVGVILFELTTGKRLFKGQSDFETLKLICDHDYPLPSQIRPGYPPELERIVMRALHKDRNSRYQTAREMQADLEEFVRRERVPVSNIALTEFMRNLFEEKLASEKQDLLAGKQLADLIDLQHSSESLPTDDHSRLSHNSSAPAARTITDLSAMVAGKHGGVALALAALGLVAAVSATGLYLQHNHEAASASLSPASLPVNRGSIRVATNPPGATIWVDGEMRSDLTPAILAQLPTGRPINVTLTKDGYEPAKQSLTLTDSESSRSVDVALSSAPVFVDLDVITDGLPFALVLDGNTTRLSANGHSIEGVTAGDSHTLVVSAPGYTSQTLEFTSSPQERKRLEVTLQRALHPRAASVPPPAPPSPPARPLR